MIRINSGSNLVRHIDRQLAPRHGLAPRPRDFKGSSAFEDATTTSHNTSHGNIIIIKLGLRRHVLSTTHTTPTSQRSTRHDRSYHQTSGHGDPHRSLMRYFCRHHKVMLDYIRDIPDSCVDKAMKLARAHLDAGDVIPKAIQDPLRYQH